MIGPTAPTAPSLPTRPWWVRPAAALLFGGIWPARVHGAELVPATGPIVLAGNHLGVLDGPLLVAACPRWTSCLVKREMFDSVAGPFLRGADQIPIDRDGADRAALALALQRLRAGGAIGVFPEGTRGRGDVAQARAGAAWLAVQAGAPVVPVAVLGTRRTGESTSRPPRPRRVDIVFGAPVEVAAPSARGRQAVADATARLQDVLAGHVRTAVELTGQALPDDGRGASGAAPRQQTTQQGGTA